MKLSGRWIYKHTVLMLGFAIGFAVIIAVPSSAEEKKAEPAPAVEKTKPAAAPAASEAVSGREIFVREWLPKDARSHGGDGLGPVFNDSSCVACHNQGATGGGGPTTKNVNIVSAFVVPQENLQPEEPSAVGQFLRALAGLPTVPAAPDAKQKAERKEQLTKQLKSELVRVHPGFKSARSVVLHHFSSDPKYNQWRSKFLENQFPARFSGGMSARVGVDFQTDSVTSVELAPPEDGEAQPAAQKIGEIAQTLVSERQRAAGELQRARGEAMMSNSVSTSNASHGNVTTTSSQRNPTALFGAGLIDSIPNDVLEAQAKAKHSNADITGRVARLENGKIGRFGWKSQKASLYDFTVTACGVELGLNVPDQAQSGQPLDPKYQPTGFDLNQREVDALVGYLKELPAPVQSTSPAQQEFIQAGQKLFSSAGCADCHTQKLGNVEGIYSDLLLHDMGDETADTGGYGVFVLNSPGNETGGEFPALTDAFQPSTNAAMASAPFAGGFAFSPSNAVSGLKARANEIEKGKIAGATRFEWRTPPLWGVRDSGPYMHDGRAATLEHAIAVHGGEAEESALEFYSLSPQEQQQLVAFLKTLVAPTELASAK